jgi:hypothetical protein
MPEGICDESGGIRPYRQGVFFRGSKKKMGVKQSALARAGGSAIVCPPEKKRQLKPRILG